MNDLLLERYNLGELGPGEKARVESVLAADSRLADRAARLRRSDKEIRDALPAALKWEEIQKKASPWHGPLGSGARGLRFSRPALGLCMAAVLAAVLFPAFWFFRRGGGEQERAKGSTELAVYLKTPDGEARVRDNTVVREGSTVQLAYMSAESRYGVIFSLDGRAALTLHYPSTAEGSTRLVSGRRTALAEAYTLDDAPDYEIFFFVTSPRAVDVEEILALAGRLAQNPETALRRGREVFRNYELQTLTLRKD
jgi:anti-sigma factor RsiW